MKRVLLSVALLFIAMEAKQVNANFLVTIDSAGTQLGAFDAGLASGQYVSFIYVDSSGSIWCGRNDEGHSRNQFNPNDMVAKFTPTGNELTTIKGSMRDIVSMALDSAGNIYIGAIPDGGSLSDEQVYKYDSAGNFITSFGTTVGSEYMEIEFTSDDRLFAINNNRFAIREFTTGGTQVRVVGSFDKRQRLGRGLALSPDETILWSYQLRSGPGEDFIVAYDLSLNVVSYFGLNAIGNPSLWGLDTLSNGNLVARSGSRILEISPAGSLVNEIDISAIDMGIGLRRGFAVDNNGNFIISSAIPEPATALLLCLGAALLSRRRKA